MRIEPDRLMNLKQRSYVRTQTMRHSSWGTDKRNPYRYILRSNRTGMSSSVRLK